MKVSKIAPIVVAASWGTVSFIWSKMDHSTALKFSQVRGAACDEPFIANFIIPGFVVPPRGALLTLADHMIGDVFIVEHTGSRLDTESYMNQICAQIDRVGYDSVRIFAISNASKIAYQLPIKHLSPEFYLINPITNSLEIRESAKKSINNLLIGERIPRFLLGPFGDVVVRKNRSSFNERFSQYEDMVRPSEITTYGKDFRIVLSSSDQISDPGIIRMECDGCRLAEIDTEHADFEKYTALYIEALESLGAFE